jgi:hypothetical protein
VETIIRCKERLLLWIQFLLHLWDGASLDMVVVCANKRTCKTIIRLQTAIVVLDVVACPLSDGGFV